MFAPGHQMRLSELRVAPGVLVRASSSGAATIGGPALDDGTGDPPPHLAQYPNYREVVASVESLAAYLNGAERWAFRWLPGELAADHTVDPDPMIEKTAGPYEVAVIDGEWIHLRCVCGWAGKARRFRARRLLIGDQAVHHCPRES